ncbi:MAG TPA: TrbC/VirB2 family protein [Candidatus Saccharimonadales bacterium]|nr:TrbC/VirB2 family protein [Candidatus Saccharimonadales bacterium]
MKQIIKITCLGLIIPALFSGNALAATAGMAQVQSFLQNVITAVAGLAGLIATGFFVVGGLRYITSSGNPQHLEKAKRTIFFSAAGLAITIAAFVLSNIVSGLANNAFGA